MPAKVWHPAAGFFTLVAARLAPSQDAQPQRFRARSPARPAENARVRAASMGRRLLPFMLGSLARISTSLRLRRSRSRCYAAEPRWLRKNTSSHEKRERLAAQGQATLEAEIAVEELRLQRLRQRAEAQRLQGPFARPARHTLQRRFHYSSCSQSDCCS